MDEQKKEIIQEPKEVPYEKQLERMSHNQLRGELRRKAKSATKPLGMIEAIVSLIVLENTLTKQNPFAKLHAYPR